MSVPYTNTNTDILTMLAAGVDGCRTGWTVAVGSATGTGRLDVFVVPCFADVLELDVGVIGVDMPIGLPDTGIRACDRAARRLLGERRSSVFPAPARGVLGAATWEEANGRSRGIDGRGIAHQTFGLLAKIAEVDALMSPTHQRRVVEVHPEAAFAAMSDGPMPFPKRTPEGRAARRTALGGVFTGIPTRLRGAAADDILDACAVLWSAARFARGDHLVLGDGSVDAKGLRMEVVV